MVQPGRGLRSKLEGAGLTQSKPYLNRLRRLDLVPSVVSPPKQSGSMLTHCWHPALNTTETQLRNHVTTKRNET